MTEPSDLEKVVDLALGHACTMVCEFCAGGVEVVKERTSYYHPDVLGRRLGHPCKATAIRRADVVEIARLVTLELAQKSRIVIPKMGG